MDCGQSEALRFALAAYFLMNPTNIRHYTAIGSPPETSISFVP
jgi:hypothetical protein